MIFQNPSAFWAFLFLIPLIVIYLLKVKPQRLETTTLFLWDKIITKKKHESLFSKLKNLLSLLLILIALSATILAMAHPVLEIDKQAEKILLIIDNSVSMTAKQGSQTRLQEAIDKAETFIENLNEHQELTLATLSGQLEVHLAASNNQLQLKEALRTIKPSQEALNPLELTQIQKNKNSASQSILISDRCFKNADSFTDIQIIPIEAQTQNLAITAFDLMRPLASKKQINAYVEILSTFTETQEIELILFYESFDNPVKILPLSIEPGLNKPELFSLLTEENGSWFVSLSHPEDDFKIDNQAYFQLDPPADIQTSQGIVENALFYQKALELFSTVSATENSKSIHISQGQASEKATQQIIVQPQGQSVFWKSINGQAESQLANSNEQKDAVLKYCDLDNIEFSGIQNIEVNDKSRVLLKSINGLPLIIQTYHQDRSAYLLNFDPESSKLFLNIQFPVLLYSLVRDSYYHHKIDKRRNFQIGEKLNSLSQAQWQTPSGQKINTTEEPLQFKETGFYQASFPDGSKQTYSVSLFNKIESQLTQPLLKNSVKQLKNYPIRTWLIIIAILIFTVESMLYHRRKLG